MLIESHDRTVKAFTIYEPGDRLDPIAVVLHDYGPGRGMLTVVCFGSAWSHYWGAMGDKRIGEFLPECSADYIMGKLLPHGDRRILKREEAYLLRIVRVVREAVKQQSVQVHSE